MYLCQSRLGPGAYQVMSYASAARVSHGYMICARACVVWLHGLHACRMVTVTWFAPVRVSRGYMVCAMDSDRRKELARLRQRRHTYHMSVPRSCENECCAIPRVAGSASFNAVAFLVLALFSYNYIH